MTLPVETLIARPAVAAVLNERPTEVGRFAESLIDVGLTAEEATAVLHWAEALPADEVYMRSLEAVLQGDDVPDPTVSGDINDDSIYTPNAVRHTDAQLSHPPAEPDDVRQALLRKTMGAKP